MSTTDNPRLLILLSGESASGKSASLRNLRNPEGVFYISTEVDKPLPFPDKFKKPPFPLTDPKMLIDWIPQIDANPDIHTVVLDSLTFLMSMFESKYVLTKTTVTKNGIVKDTLSGWSDYQEYFKKIFLDLIAKSPKNWIIIAHNEKEQLPDGQLSYKVVTKGALAKQSIESYFSLVFYARRIDLTEVDQLPVPPNEECFTITPKEKSIGVKHIIQCDVTEEFAHSKIRSPIGCFGVDQIFWNNDMQLIIDYLIKYYKQ